MSKLANICRPAFLMAIAAMAGSGISAQDPLATATQSAGAQEHPSYNVVADPKQPIAGEERKKCRHDQLVP